MNFENDKFPPKSQIKLLCKRYFTFSFSNWFPTVSIVNWRILWYKACRYSRVIWLLQLLVYYCIVSVWSLITLLPRGPENCSDLFKPRMMSYRWLHLIFTLALSTCLLQPQLLILDYIILNMCLFFDTIMIFNWNLSVWLSLRISGKNINLFKFKVSMIETRTRGTRWRERALLWEIYFVW